MHKTSFLLAFLLTAWSLTLSVGAHATPLAVVEKLQNALITNAGNPDFSERLETISPTIKEAHDFASIARLVTGRHWRKLEEQQQVEFIDVFTQLSVVTYADRFKNLGVSRFTYVETLEQPRNSKKVVSIMTLDSNTDFAELSDKKELSFEYILQSKADESASDLVSNADDWQIINVVVDGISDLALKRSNYVNILNENGFEALIEELKQKISDVQEKASQEQLKTEKVDS